MLSSVKISTQISWENREKPTKKSTTFQNNKEGQEENQCKSCHNRRNARSKRKTDAGDLTHSYLHKVFDCIDIANEIVHNELSTILIDDNLTNSIDIKAVSEEIIEIKWKMIEHGKSCTSLLFELCHRTYYITL